MRHFHLFLAGFTGFFFVFFLLIGCPGRVRADSTVSLSLDPSQTHGQVNPFVWGVNGPDKDIYWGGNANLIQRIKDANIKIMRVHPIQIRMHALKKDTCTSPTQCDYSTMDAILKTVFDAGAEPIFQVTGYPGGIGHYDWEGYATFMRGVVKRYNVDLVLGKKIRFFEMWNEPTGEPDGNITPMSEYGKFVTTVGGAIKSVDPTVKILGPVWPWADIRSVPQGGEIAYTAQNIPVVDILTWHNYGTKQDSPQARLMATKTRYYDEFIKVRDGSEFIGPNNKHYDRALTEFQVALGDLPEGNQNYQNEYAATYIASALVNSIRAETLITTMYDFQESWTNLLGLTQDSQQFTPRKSYYTYVLFGNHLSGSLVFGSGGSDALEYVGSVSSDKKKMSVLVVNKSVNTAAQVTLQIAGTTSNSYQITTLDHQSAPLTTGTGTLSSGKLIRTFGPLSVSAIDITLSGSTSSVASPACVADITKDGIVDVSDYSKLIGSLFKRGTNTADLNKDGVVDIFDYSLLVGSFLQHCTQ